ncbi:MAG: hypothetical protein RL070_1559 [Bacteroidota bacterium]
MLDQKRIVWALCFFMLACFLQPAFGQRNILSKAFTQKELQNKLSNIAAWRLAQKNNYLQKVAALPDSVKARLVKEGDKGLKYDWPALPASLYLDYKITGTRYNFERKNNERRKILNELAVAAIITKDKKYIPQIANGIWTLCEQSTWVLPAHIVVQKEKTGLPDPYEVVIDLGSGTAAAQLSMIQFMLRDELDAYSKGIGKRVFAELNKRIFQPYLSRNDFWWMGFTGQPVNNWNPWVNTNVLMTALYSDLTADSVGLLIDKTVKSTDIFVNQYPDDGGCDEGPSYWSEAGGKLMRFIHVLNKLTNTSIDWKQQQLIYNMGSYISKVHIGDNNFVNFADAFSKSIPDPESVYSYGALFNDVPLKSFGAYLFGLQKHKLDNGNIIDFLETTSIYDSLTTLPPIAPLPAVSWFGDRQVLTARTKSESTKGLFLAVQGGHNAESHNHNDIGNFIVYANNTPVFVDAGVGSYTAQTFSSKRYELWNMQSVWHNCPTINGVMQKEGIQYKATNVLYAKNTSGVSVSMDIAMAYPTEAAVKKYERKFDFDQSKNTIQLFENYEMLEWKSPLVQSFLVFIKPTIEKPGQLSFALQDGASVTFKYDAKLFDIAIEDKQLDDERIIGIWGKQLYRIQLVAKGNKKAGKHNFSFALINDSNSTQ